MKKSGVNIQVPQVSLCRKGSWGNSGLPNALNQSIKEKFGLNFTFSDGQNLSSTKDVTYKDYVRTLFDHESQGFIFTNNYLLGIPKLIFIESDVCLEEIQNAPYFDDVIGFLSFSSKEKKILDKPVFQNTDVDQISDFIFNFIKESLTSKPLYGLALVGGKSQRMKKDKGSLDYFGKAQGSHVYDLLGQFCDKVYMSIREEQSTLPYLRGLEDSFLPDRFLGLGPMGGILTAFHEHPEASWLVLACDLPYVSNKDIETLIQSRNYFKKATCFKNPVKGWAEPLCTIYETSAVQAFHQYLSLGVKCPRKVLMNIPHELVEVSSDSVLKNINTPDGYEEAKTNANLRPHVDQGSYQ